MNQVTFLLKMLPNLPIDPMKSALFKPGMFESLYDPAPILGYTWLIPILFF